MILQIDFESDQPLYAQIRDQVVIGIAAGLLQPGESLPSVRRLAADIGINVHTVHKAYARLKDEGYVDIDRRSGAKIASVPSADETFARDLEKQIKPLVAASLCRGMDLDDFFKLVRQVHEAITEEEDS